MLSHSSLKRSTSRFSSKLSPLFVCLSVVFSSSLSRKYPSQVNSNSLCFTIGSSQVSKLAISARIRPRARDLQSKKSSRNLAPHPTWSRSSTALWQRLTLAWRSWMPCRQETTARVHARPYSTATTCAVWARILISQRSTRSRLVRTQKRADKFQAISCSAWRTRRTTSHLPMMKELLVLTRGGSSRRRQRAAKWTRVSR